MEEKIKDIMQEYIKNVEDTCNILLEGINYSDNLNLKTKKDFFIYRMETSKMEFEIKGVSYRLHGKGCVAFKKDFFWIGILDIEVDGAVLILGNLR